MQVLFHLLFLLLFIGIPLLCWFFRADLHPWLTKHATLIGAYRSVTAIVLFPLALYGGIFAYFQFMEKLKTPEVALEFEGLSTTSIAVRNIGNVVVREPKYWVVLFNVDNLHTDKWQNTPALQIPARTGDYISPNDRWGPNTMIGLPQVRERVKDSNRLLGWAKATCPECKTRSYILSIVVGKSGWYAEFPEEEVQDLLISLLGGQRGSEAIEASVKMIEDRVPATDRILIK